MTTITYTRTATTAAPVTANGKAIAAFNTFNTFLNVFFGATADNDSAFRGLDMNGNAMWARK